MYTRGGLQGFFLIDAAKTAVKAVVGAVKAVSSTASQTGSTTPIYTTTGLPPVPPSPNYTPWLIGGALALGAMILSRRGRR